MSEHHDARATARREAPGWFPRCSVLTTHSAQNARTHNAPLHSITTTTLNAIALAQTYVAEEGMDIKFAVSIVDLENPEIRSDTVTSTYLHFALIAK